jgi:hypothetical protein
MGKIANDMARLAESIIDARAERAEMKARLADEADARRTEVNAKLNEISSKQAAQAKRDKTARVQFVNNLSDKVGTMLNDFDAAHQDMAKRTKATRKATVNRIKTETHNSLDAFAEEMEIAREVWRNTTGKQAVRSKRAVTTHNSDALGSLTRDFAADLPQRPRFARIRTRRRG